MKRWILRVLVSIDQLVNTIAGGDEDETISSRVGRRAEAGDRLAIALEGMIDALFAVLVGQRRHCVSNIEREI